MLSRAWLPAGRVATGLAPHPGSVDSPARTSYRLLLPNTKANEARLKAAGEFSNKEMGDSGFGATLVRHALFAVCKTMETESPRDGLNWLATEVKDYAAARARILEILEFLATLRHHASLPHWRQDAEAAAIVAGALRNRMDDV